jgi:magnesium chelatase family protein
MSSKLIKQHCKIDESSKQILKKAMERLSLSARAYDRILKVSRTIADLSGHQNITTEDLAEALHYRSLDRSNWGS